MEVLTGLGSHENFLTWGLCSVSAPTCCPWRAGLQCSISPQHKFCGHSSVSLMGTSHKAAVGSGRPKRAPPQPVSPLGDPPAESCSSQGMRVRSTAKVKHDGVWSVWMDLVGFDLLCPSEQISNLE